MSKLVSSRAFRLLVCLLVVCCILVNASPIRAKATAVVPAASAALVGITPLGAVVGILACLGLAYVASGSFEATCKKLADSLPSRFLSFSNSQTVVEGLSYEDSVYVSEELVEYVASSVTLGLDDNTAFPLPQRAAPFIQALLSSSVYSYYQSYHSNWSLATYIGLSNGEHQLILHDTTVSYKNNTNSCTIVYPMPCIRYVGTVDLDTYPEYKGSITGGNEMSMSGQSSRTMNLDGVTVSSFLTVDLTSAVFQPYFEAAPDLDDDEEYQAWKARRLFRVIEGGGGDEDPDEDPDDGLRVLLPYYPVPAAENAENLPSSQDQAWVGNRQEDPEDDPVTDLAQSVEVSTTPEVSPSPEPNPDPEPVPEPEPEPDPDPEPAPEPAPDPQPSQALAGTSLEPFVLPSLRNFFPFCIPFDLYDMLAAFVTEPEAPVFTFATGFLGNVFTVDIDLSPWNSIAKTVRAIQLCICIVGLAFATRKFIKW